MNTIYVVKHCYFYDMSIIQKYVDGKLSSTMQCYVEDTEFFLDALREEVIG